ncbi:MAG: thermonuclease family protein [Deltaproteobacteria bacterium]|nr:thermonuclease family protein [Deltaproteobacteria bacterium]
MRSTIGSLLLLPVLAAGCQGSAGSDPAGDSGTGEMDAGTVLEDSGYDPAVGIRFSGPIILDDDRVLEMDPSPLVAEPFACRDPVLARVTRVVDGDTLLALGISTELDERVRLIGVDTPELGADGLPADCYGDEARDFTDQLDGRAVWLTFDRDCTDRYGRLLAYVWVGPGPQDLWERQLLARGYGWQTTFTPNDAHEATLQSDEETARRAGTGLWSECR